MEHLPERICPDCGRKYQRHYCPYCVKEQNWNRFSLEEQMPGLTPRMYDDLRKLEKYPFDLTPRSCFCYGTIKTGKTMFAVKMLYDQMKENYLHNKGRKFLILKTAKLQNELLAAEKSYEVIDKYQKTGWLLIDDFGVNKDNEWLYNVIYDIIDYRYEYMLPTIITSNYNLDVISNMLEDYRITRRIADMCEQIKFSKIYGV